MPDFADAKDLNSYLHACSASADSLSISPALPGSLCCLSGCTLRLRGLTHMDCEHSLPSCWYQVEGGASRRWREPEEEEQRSCLGMTFLSGRWSWAAAFSQEGSTSVRLAAGNCSASWVPGLAPSPDPSRAPTVSHTWLNNRQLF